MRRTNKKMKPTIDEGKKRAKNERKRAWAGGGGRCVKGDRPHGPVWRVGGSRERTQKKKNAFTAVSATMVFSSELSSSDNVISLVLEASSTVVFFFCSLSPFPPFPRDVVVVAAAVDVSVNHFLFKRKNQTM
jgi:hypothetical protein